MIHTGAGQGAIMWLWVVIAASFTTSFAMSGRMSIRQVPNITPSQEASSLASLWRQVLKKQHVTNEREQIVLPRPKTFLEPTHNDVINWVPQDSAHPLYKEEHTQLLHEILLDGMLMEQVTPKDSRMTRPGGLTVTNFNGRGVTFIKTPSGITVNGVRVVDNRVNEDGTVTYILEDSLFDHRKRVQQAWIEDIMEEAEDKDKRQTIYYDQDYDQEYKKNRHDGDDEEEGEEDDGDDDDDDDMDSLYNGGEDDYSGDDDDDDDYDDDDDDDKRNRQPIHDTDDEERNENEEHKEKPVGAPTNPPIIIID